jgi:type II secretory pathway pseudopilin PulG
MCARGFSIVELIVALAVSLLIASAVFAMIAPAGDSFQVQPESADVQQRLRVAIDTLHRDLGAAGAGPATTLGADGARQLAPGTFPFRVGRSNPDPPGIFGSDRIAAWYVSASAPQAWLAAPLASAAGTATIAPGAGCADGDPSCGFRPGMLVGVFGPSGAWDLFSITAVEGPLLSLQHNLRDSATVYPPLESAIAEITVRTYFFREDRATGLPQLMRYDAAGGGDIPVVDHVAQFSVEYFGDAEPPLPIAGGEGEPDRVTYGPPPPPLEEQRSQYPPGENCAFARTAGGAVVSRLASLGAGGTLVAIGGVLLTDGPWCPDATSPNRYDADLLRVRAVAIDLTIEAAVASLRGPAGMLFTRAGTARGTRVVPDRHGRITISPRAMNGGR